MSATAVTVTTKKIVGDLMAKGTVTIKRATEKFGIGRTRLYDLMQDGALPYSQIGARRLIPVVALENLIAENMIGVESQEGI